MFKHKANKNSGRLLKKLSATFLVISTFIGIDLVTKQLSFANTGYDFIWDTGISFTKLKYRQSSNERNDRSIYYLFLRSIDRKTGIEKLTILVPKYFDAEIKPNKLTFCKVKMGGYSSKTRCLKTIPSLITINGDQTSIEIYPDQPIPLDRSTYALKMKIINPRKAGMFQFHAYAQAPGNVTISNYLGTWNMDVR